MGADARTRAIVVAGLAPDVTTAEASRSQAQETANLLRKRGVSASDLTLLGASASEKVSKESILQALVAARQLKASDDFWLVLYGQSAVGADGAIAYQISGPRLGVKELKEHLDAIPARQSILIATASSGGFLQTLLKPGRQVITATEGVQESELPKLAETWNQAFRENPSAPFSGIANRAAALVDDYYKKSGLAQTEHARLADGVSGKILSPPFATAEAATPSLAATRGPVALLSASDIEFEIKDPNAEWEQQPATAATKALVAEARKTPNPLGYPALLLEQRLGYTVAPDRTTDTFTFRRIYLASDDDPAPWTNYLFPQNPPAVTTKLEVARIVQPDGSATVFNPAKLAAGSDCTSGMCGSLSNVFLPNAKAGCVIEIGWRTRSLLDATLPELSENLALQQSVPVLKSTVQVRVPNQAKYKAKLMNNAVKPMTDTEKDWKTLTWTLPETPALESLPNDPPMRDFAQWVAISSLASWNDFTLWFRRLARDSDVVDDLVKQKARELASGAGTRGEKLQKAFNFVSSLRYIAIEIGVQGFRPRTPSAVLQNRYGDCKDKANLLGALLRTMGIEAHLALINRGSSTDVDFPSWQFNHAICFVPANAKDGQTEDLWLDSTDTVAPFGFIAPGNVGRSAFVVEPAKSYFKTVVPPGGSLTTTLDEWTFENDGKEAWAGKFKRTTTGMADYLQRAQNRSLGPKQRQYSLQSSLAEMIPGARVREGTFAHLNDLARPVEMSANLEGVAVPDPGLPDWLHHAFVATERDRPLVLNDAQPFSFRQTLRVKSTLQGKTPPPDFSSTVASGKARFTVSWKSEGADVRVRSIEVRFDQAVVAPADYAAARGALAALENKARWAP